MAARIRFEQVDLVPKNEAYDLVLSNPPYIPSSDIDALEDEVRVHEPRAALEAGADGLDVVKRLLAVAADATDTGAHMLIELGAGQSPAVAALADANPSWEMVAAYADLNRIERVAHLRRT